MPMYPDANASLILRLGDYSDLAKHYTAESVRAVMLADLRTHAAYAALDTALTAYRVVSSRVGHAAPDARRAEQVMRDARDTLNAAYRAQEQARKELTLLDVPDLETLYS